ncbi:MAG: S8 family serine peptidase [FCB group bacterium]|jgi:hypothetical protein|nr:S8 family serine peptidase [FCB group bacterium]
MSGEKYQHLFFSGTEQVQGFTSSQQGRDKLRLPQRDSQLHGSFLRERLNQAWNEIDDRLAVVHSERHGAYIEFEGAPGFDLKTKSLEFLPSGIRLCNVRRSGNGADAKTLATLYVPNQSRTRFLKLIDAWVTPSEGKDPRNGPLLRGIEDIRRAVLESFWRMEERSQIPLTDFDWVEVWTNMVSDEEIANFRELLLALEIESRDGELKFPERSVLLIQANAEQLAGLIEESDHIVEFRPAKQVATFYVEMENQEQVAHVRALLGRTRYESDGQVVVCILDGGVNNGHALLQEVLAANDMHAVMPQWGSYDDDGHGTLMAGTAIYGDLLRALEGSSIVRVVHRLESSKILPPPPARNSKELWGHRTAQGVSLAEIQAPMRQRIICLAVTSDDDRDRGRPSSWSGSIDAIASGRDEETKRLIIVSAGNVDDPICWRNYPNDNMTNQVHDPAQAWNALTVGAFTEKVQISDPTLTSYSPIAPAGGLSPYSTTSSDWHQRRWPIKPEVLLEGGNVARGPNDSMFDTEDLKLLSTWHDFQQAQLAPFCATSAATAQAAWMAAQIQASYPIAWPETVRGLLVHSAVWSDTMLRQFLPTSAPSKQHVANFLRICGYGVPSLSRALYSLASSLTLIAQAELQPFDKRGSRYVTKEMHLHDVPWPTDVLASLGESQVTMRLTLSYFVEPGPGEVGYSNRYRYSSHALRFSLNGPHEEQDDFVRRVNRQAREDGEGHPGTAGPADKWFIGDARNVGSIHSDIWRGTAAELATSNLIAVYPATGWWRERPHLERWESRCRYSLIVSIQTPEQEVDIYTPVAVQLGIPVPIPVS